MADNNIFRLENVKVWFPIQEGFLKKTVGHVKAVDDVTINVGRNETLGIVGESGCGKTTRQHGCEDRLHNDHTDKA